jgi:hypothetical protein
MAFAKRFARDLVLVGIGVVLLGLAWALLEGHQVAHAVEGFVVVGVVFFTMLSLGSMLTGGSGGWNAVGVFPPMIPNPSPPTSKDLGDRNEQVNRAALFFFLALALLLVRIAWGRL